MKYLYLLLAFMLVLVGSAQAVIYVPSAGATGAAAEGGMFAWMQQTASSAYAGLDQVYDAIVTVGTYIETIPTQIYYGFMTLS